MSWATNPRFVSFRANGPGPASATDAGVVWFVGRPLTLIAAPGGSVVICSEAGVASTGAAGVAAVDAAGDAVAGSDAVLFPFRNLPPNTAATPISSTAAAATGITQRFFDSFSAGFATGAG